MENGNRSSSKAYSLLQKQWCCAPQAQYMPRARQPLPKEHPGLHRQDEQRGLGRGDDWPDILTGMYQRSDLTPAVQERPHDTQSTLETHMTASLHTPPLAEVSQSGCDKGTEFTSSPSTCAVSLPFIQ